jgi:hypothetical protein
MSSNNINSENINNGINSISTNRINNLRRIASTRCCSFCKQQGHMINNCTDEAFLNFELSCIGSKNLFENTDAPLNMFKRWLLEKFLENSAIVKAFAIRKCGCTIRSHIQKCLDSITNYIYNIQNNNENNVFIPFSNENDPISNENEILGLSGMLLLSGYSNENIVDIIMTSINHENNKYKFTTSIEALEKGEQSVLCDCSICFENYEMDKFVKFNCNHKFCGDCVIETIKTIKTSKINNLPCPLCRAEISSIVAYTKEVKNKVEIIKNT